MSKLSQSKRGFALCHYGHEIGNKLVCKVSLFYASFSKRRVRNIIEVNYLTAAAEKMPENGFPIMAIDPINLHIVVAVS